MNNQLLVESAQECKSQPTLETKRLTIRPFYLSDAKDLQRLSGDFAVADTTLNIPHPYPDGAAEEYISARPAAYEIGECASFAITLRESGELIGGIGLNVKHQFRRGNLGYWIAKSFWGQGYATEAGRAVVDFGFRDWSLHKIEAGHFKRNPASGRVMEKIGFVPEGILRDHILKWEKFEDVVMWAIIKTI